MILKKIKNSSDLETGFEQKLQTVKIKCRSVQTMNQLFMWFTICLFPKLIEFLKRIFKEQKPRGRKGRFWCEHPISPGQETTRPNMTGMPLHRQIGAMWTPCPCAAWINVPEITGNIRGQSYNKIKNHIIQTRSSKEFPPLTPTFAHP